MTTVKETVDNIGFGGFTASNQDVQNAMKDDEIKEILDFIDDRVIPNEKWDKVKDYITNLQESEAYYYGQYKDYKLRNKKAIKILKEYENDNEANRYAPIRETINILQGDYNE